MSKRNGPVPNLAIEYSARGIAVYDPNTGTTQSFPDLGSAGALFNGRMAVIGLSRRSAFLRTVRVPNAGPEEIRQVLMIRAADLFPLGQADLAMDFRLTDDINEEGRLAVVAAVPTSELRKIVQDARAAGLRVLGVLPVSFGSASIARHLNQTNVAIVSRDQEGIGIDIVFRGEVRQSRLVAPTAGIESEVCRTYSLANIPCGQIIASGGVILREPDQTISDTPLAALIDAFPAKVGLDLRLPEVVESERKRAQSKRQRQALLLAAAAACLLLYVANDRSETAAQVDIATRQYQKPLSSLKSQRSQSEKDAQTSVENWNTLKVAFQPAQRVGDTIALVSNRVPEGVWLSGLSIERGKPMIIRGTAKTSDAVAAYMQNLTLEPRLRDVHLVFANTGLIEQTPVQQFSLSAFPVGNLPLLDPTKKVKAVAKAR